MTRTRQFGVLVVVAALALWGSAAAAATAGPALGGASVGVADADDASVAQVQQQQQQDDDDGNASVAFADQAAANGTVTVENVTVPEGGYVVIHDDALLEGDALGSVVGASAYLEAGSHENVSVALFEGVAGVDFGNESAPNGTETLIAMPHEETSGDNETYDFVASDGADDGPYTVDGEAVVDDAAVTFAADGEQADDRGLVVESLSAPEFAAPNATVAVNATVGNTLDEERSGDVAFRLAGDGADVVVRQNVTVNAAGNETVTFELNASDVGHGEYIHGVTTENSSGFATVAVTNESQVRFTPAGNDAGNATVDSVFVPEGGYVAVHDNTLLEGDAVGSVVGVSAYLEPGVHEDVSVALFGNVSGAEFDGNASVEPGETLIAMPHLETTGDETYDFVASDGADDGPYTVDGEPVLDFAAGSEQSAGAGDGAGDGGQGGGDGAGDDGDGDDGGAQGDETGDGDDDDDDGQGSDEGQGEGQN